MDKESKKRFKEIVKVFVSYGFGFLTSSKKNREKRSPENFRKALEELGPTFIKIGQILSTRPDLIPDSYIKELIKLQDSTSNISFEEVVAEYKDSIGRSVEDDFFYFEPNPLASASIAQVHEGILMDGRRVVVKVQRPEIASLMKMDIAILKKIIKLAEGRIEISVVDPLSIIEEIEYSTERELDFINEAINIVKFKENNKDVSYVYAPIVVRELCSDKILTLEKIEGFKINDLKSLKENGYDTKEIANKLALSYCKQIFDDGFFHGDPHPGNIMIFDGKICFLDFGIAGELSSNLRNILNDAMLAVASGDKRKLVDCILAIGIKKGKIDIGELYNGVSYLVDTYLSTSLKNIKVQVVLEEVFNLARDNNIQFPKDLIILMRGLVILEGVVADIDPELEISSVIISFIKGKGKFAFFKSIAEEQVLLDIYSFFKNGIKVPAKTVEALDSIAEGRVKVNLNLTEVDKTLSSLNKMVNRIVGSLLTAALVLASALITSKNVGPVYKGISLLGIIGYSISAIFIIVLLVSMIKAGEFKNKK